MPKNKNHRRQQRTVSGSAKPVEVAMGDKRRRAFLATIENDGRDATGRVMGSNGIAWRVA